MEECYQRNILTQSWEIFRKKMTWCLEYRLFRGYPWKVHCRHALGCLSTSSLFPSQQGPHHILILSLAVLVPRQRNLLSLRYNGGCAVCVSVCCLCRFAPRAAPAVPLLLQWSRHCVYVCVYTVMHDNNYNRSRGLNRPRHPGGYPQNNEKGYGWS